MAAFDTICQTLSFDRIVNYHENNGVGIFAKYKAFKFLSNSEIEPITNCDNVSLKDLKDYKREQNIVIENTLGFLKEKPYNNILLYGDRGTGKSSTVKAILNEYSKRWFKIDSSI